MPINPTTPGRVVSPNKSTGSAPNRAINTPPKRSTRTISAPPTNRAPAVRTPLAKTPLSPMPSPQATYTPPQPRAPMRPWPADNFKAYYQDHVRSADEQLDAGNTAAAKETLQECLSRLNDGVRQFKDTPTIQGRLRDWVADVKLRISNINSGATQTAGAAPVAVETSQQQADADVQGLVEGCVVKDVPKIAWTDVIGIEEAVSRVREAVEMPYLFPQLFKEGGLQPWRGILLWGPPGTGKTMLAQAAATAVGAKFYVVSPAETTSKWMGQSEKFVKELFRSAREQPSIIFVDEIDAILKARAEGEHEATRRMKTQFLQEMEGFKPQQRVTVIGATNVPWEIDDAALRRLEARAWVALPNEEARFHLLKSKVREFENTITDEQFRELAAISHNFSGNDIRVAVKAAGMETATAIMNAKFFAKNENGFYEPCEEGTADAIPRPSPQLCKDLELQTGLTFKQLKAAVIKNPPAVDQVRMAKYDAYKKRLENDRS